MLQLSAQENVFSYTITKNSVTKNAKNTKAVNVNRVLLNQIISKYPNDFIFKIPLIDEGFLNVNMKQFSVLNPEHNLIIESVNGKIKEEYSPDFQSYYILHEGKSIGTFLCFENSIVISYKHNNRQFEINKIDNKFLLFDVNDCLLENTFSCKVEEKMEQINREENFPESSVINPKCLELAIEIDEYTRNTFSTNVSTTNWAHAILAGVSQVYFNEVNINITIVTTIIWETTDPYAAYISDASNMLDALRNHWTANNSSISRDLVHLLTKRSNTGTGGIAYVDVLCNNSWGYGFSASLNNTTNFNFPNPPYTWNLLVCSHEIGHNIGSNHTHWCGWPGGPIDNCTDVEGSCTNNPVAQVGTIMSYCHTTSSGSLIDFHSIVVSNALMPEINGASCLTTCADYGCTDFNATNYDPNATIDDGSCIYAVYGCTDPNAINYIPNATVDDGSCTYSPLVLTAIISNISCNSSNIGISNDGNINLSVTGGAVPFSYSWNNGVTTQDLSALTVGTYVVTVSDVVGQFVTATYVVNTPAPITVNYTINSSTGPGFADGSVAVSVAGGIAPYSYYWIGANGFSATSQDLQFALAGTYSYYVIDNNGCYELLSIIIPEGQLVGCTDSTSCNYDPNATSDDGSCYGAMGCTDTSACNYDAVVCIDDGSCEYNSCNTTCGASPITGLGVTNVIHDRVTLTFDNMNTYEASGAQVCRVDQLRIRYRELGSSTWNQKNMATPTGYSATTGICNSTNKTDKLVLGLIGSTTYEWEMKVWYCAAGSTGWVDGPGFTTADNCPNVGNLVVTSGSSTQATFTWDDSSGAYSFVRLKARVDINTSPWFNIGGMGVNYPTFTKNKNGLVSGETYRGQARTWCDPAGGAYKSLTWTSLVFWTQPTSSRIGGGSAINNFVTFPNPSKDIFNVSFTSVAKQDLRIRILNVIGEELINDKKQEFIGEYTKQINLSAYTKGVYFLEITTNNGVVNKKLILQ